MAKYVVSAEAKYNYATESSTFTLERDSLAEAVELAQKYIDKRFPDENKITHAMELIELPEPPQDEPPTPV